VTSDDITVAPFPGFNDPQTRSTDPGAGHDKDKWESGDVIYIQLNGTGSWYTMKYDGSTWSISDFPGMTREDSYKAVYAPNYEPNSDGTDLKLKSDAQPATAEYLTCEGTKPINISFKRDYARIRLYTGGLTGSYKTLLDAAGGFKSDDGFNYLDSSLPMSGCYTYTFTPDEYDNAYLYGTWSAYGIYFTQFVPDFGDTYLYLGPKCPNGGYTVNTASSANKSYVVDLSYVTLDLDEATKAVKDWSSVVNAGITKVKMAGEWNSSYQHSFSAMAYTDNAKITSIDLSGVTGLDKVDLPSFFCYNCSSLSELKLPNDLISMPDYGFYDCSNLKEIDIPSSVTCIGQGTLKYCSNLASIELPQELKTILDFAFQECSSLRKVVCNAKNTPGLGYDIFHNTPKDKVLYVPDGCVEAYKAQTSSYGIDTWSSVFGDNIKPISEMPEDE
jgi:hypothetical protein